MNFLGKRKIDSQINDIVKKLTFKNHKIKLAGSASLASQKYFSDYDFNCRVLRKYKQTTYMMNSKRFLNILTIAYILWNSKCNTLVIPKLKFMTK